MTTDEFERFRISGGFSRPYRRHIRSGQSPKRFLKGPIGWQWLTEAAALRGAALATGLAIWFLYGVTGNRTNQLTYRRLAELKVRRHAAYRALRKLEAAGLIKVKRQNGRPPLITLIDEWHPRQ